MKIGRFIFVFLLVFSLSYGEVIENDFVKQKDYQRDLSSLEGYIKRHPKDLDVLRGTIILAYSLEKFPTALKYIENYLSIKKDKDIAYLKIIVLKNMGKYKEAAQEIDRYIKEYRIASPQKEILNYQKELILKENFKGVGFFKGAKLLYKDSLIYFFQNKDNLFLKYDFLKNKISFLKVDKGKVKEDKAFFSFFRKIDIDLKDVLSLDFSPSFNEVVLSIKKGIRKARIYIAKRTKNKSWTLDELEVANIGDFNAYPNFSRDGKCILFVSDKTREKSGFDIYFSCRNDKGVFSSPKKLKKVNTILDEKALYWSEDGSYLYFVSNGYIGYGGYDIYRAHIKYKDNKILVDKIEFLKDFSTYRDENLPPWFSIDGELGFLNFKYEKTYWVYIVRNFLPPPITYLHGIVLDESTKKPISGASVKIAILGSRDMIFLNTDGEGRFYVALDRRKEYVVGVSYKNYFYVTKKIAFSPTRRFLEEVFYLKKQKVEKGFKFIVKNLYFDTGSSKIRPESYPELENLYKFLKEHPNIVVEISGHTDNRGSFAYNMQLSKERAEAVREYLIKKGILPDRLIARGYGPTKPIASNSTEEGRQKNRRVEIKVLKVLK